MYSFNKYKYLRSVVMRNPLDLIRVLRIALTTAKYRYIKRCVGKGTVVGERTRIVNSANVHIGNGCLLQDEVYIRAGTEGKVTIGHRAAINSFARLFGHGSLHIGEDTQIGPGTLITTTEHDYGADLATHFKPVVIGKRVWIGANVTILAGVEVGDFAVIGAGSVVTRNIPPYAVAVGYPARVVNRYDPSPSGQESQPARA